MNGETLVAPDIPVLDFRGFLHDELLRLAQGYPRDLFAPVAAQVIHRGFFNESASSKRQTYASMCEDSWESEDGNANGDAGGNAEEDDEVCVVNKESRNRRRPRSEEARALSEHMQRMQGTWVSSSSRKEKVVAAKGFPEGWTVIVSLRWHEGRCYLEFRDYTSPDGRSWPTFKEASSHLISSLKSMEIAGMLDNSGRAEESTVKPEKEEDRKRDDFVDIESGTEDVAVHGKKRKRGVDVLVPREQKPPEANGQMEKNDETVKAAVQNSNSKQLAEQINNSKLAEQNSNSKLAEQNSISKLAEQINKSKLAEQNSISKLAEQINNSKLAEQNKLAEQISNSKLAEQNKLAEQISNSKLAEQNNDSKRAEKEQQLPATTIAAKLTDAQVPQNRAENGAGSERPSTPQGRRTEHRLENPEAMADGHETLHRKREENDHGSKTPPEKQNGDDGSNTPKENQNGHAFTTPPEKQNGHGPEIPQEKQNGDGSNAPQEHQNGHGSNPPQVMNQNGHGSNTPQESQNEHGSRSSQERDARRAKTPQPRENGGGFECETCGKVLGTKSQYWGHKSGHARKRKRGEVEVSTVPQRREVTPPMPVAEDKKVAEEEMVSAMVADDDIVVVKIGKEVEEQTLSPLSGWLDEGCQECKISVPGNELAICSWCEKEYHLSCVGRSAGDVLPQDWTCPACTIL